MTANSAVAQAHPNIAFIKYWGNKDEILRLPENGSISMNLQALHTRTTATIDHDASADTLSINGEVQEGLALSRARQYLEKVREIYSISGKLRITSENNFPMAAGIASSASAFAALAAAVNALFELELNSDYLSALARLGSGSASRSVPPGYCEWFPGKTHADSYARSIADSDHWQLWDCVAVVAKEEKKIGSTQGHKLASTSPLQDARLKNADERLSICREAIFKKDFEQLAAVIELDSDMMHAVMMTSRPPIMYWQGASVSIMHEIRRLRSRGIEAAYTLDAGPNVHIISTPDAIRKIEDHFRGFNGISSLITSPVGDGARLISVN